MSELNPEQPPRSERRFISQFLFDASVFLAIATTLLFLMGWYYQQGYYSYFELDVATLDLPVYEVLISSITPILNLIMKTDKLIYTLIVISGIVAVVKAVRNEFYGQRLEGKILTKVQGWFPESPADISDSEIPIIGQSRPQQSSAKRILIGMLPFDHTINRLFRWAMFLVLALFWLTTFLFSLSFAWRQGKKKGEQDYQQPSTRVRLSFRKEESQFFDPQLVAANRDESLMLLVQTKELVIAFAKDNDQKLENGVFIVPRVNLLSVHNEPIRRPK